MNCPICSVLYTKNGGSRKSRHHIFPKKWYRDPLTVFVCQDCHDEFHEIFSQDRKWTRADCIHHWVIFCDMKGRDPLKIYPKLKKLLVAMKLDKDIF